MTGNRWTDEEIELLEECYKKKLPLKLCSEIIKRSPCSIRIKAANMGFTQKYIKSNNANTICV